MVVFLAHSRKHRSVELSETQVVARREFRRPESVLVVVTAYIGAHSPFPNQDRAVKRESVQITVAQMVFHFALPIVERKSPLYDKSFHRTHRGEQFGHRAERLHREFGLVEPLTAIRIEVADILLFGVLHSTVQSGGRIIKSHSRHGIERA